MDGGLITLVARLDATLFLAATALLFLARSLQRPGRVSRMRAMETLLSATLFMMVGVRYAVLCGMSLAAADTVAGRPLTEPTALAFTIIYALVAAAGFFTALGTLARRVAGALLFAGVALTALAARLLIAPVPWPERLDTALGAVVGCAAAALALWIWTRRAAVPDPLGQNDGPIDY